MIRKIFVSLIILFAINYFLGAVTVFNLGRTYLNEEFYKGDVSKKISDILVENVVKNVTAEKDALPTSKEDFEKFLKEVFSQEFVYEEAKSLLTQIKSYEEKKKLVLSFEFLKTNASKITSDFAKQTIEAMPECTTSVQSNCLPKNTDKKKLEKEMQSNLDKQIVAYIPKEIEIDSNPYIKKYVTYLSQILVDEEFYKFILIMSCVGILLLIALIIFSPLHSIIRWEATTIFFTGLSLLISGLAIDQIWLFTKDLNPNLTKEMMNNLTYFLSFLVHDYYYIGFMATGVGFIMYIIAHLAKPYYIKELNKN